VYFSGGDAERALDEAHLANDIAFRQPADLSFADDVHGLVSRDGAECAVWRPEPLARHHPLLHKAMILFTDVVHVLRWPTPALPPQFARLLQLSDCGRVSWMAIPLMTRGRTFPALNAS